MGLWVVMGFGTVGLWVVMGFGTVGLPVVMGFGTVGLSVSMGVGTLVGLSVSSDTHLVVARLIAIWRNKHAWYSLHGARCTAYVLCCAHAKHGAPGAACSNVGWWPSSSSRSPGT